VEKLRRGIAGLRAPGNAFAIVVDSAEMARRTKSLDVLLPALYLRGISTGDFQEVLTPCSARTRQSFARRDRSIERRMGRRIQALAKRDLSARRYVYVWADGVYLQARMEPQANACWC